LAAREQKPGHLERPGRERIDKLIKSILGFLQLVALDQHPDQVSYCAYPTDTRPMIKHPARVSLRVGQLATVVRCPRP
jgi:hypothetical protein